jgi:hypothetical protein
LGELEETKESGKKRGEGKHNKKGKKVRKSRRKLMKANGKGEKAKKCKWANQRCQWQHQGMQSGCASQFCGRKQLKIERRPNDVIKKIGSIEKEGKPPHPNRNEGKLEWKVGEEEEEEERMRNAKGGEGRVRHHFIIKTILGIKCTYCVYLLFYF